MHQLLMRNSHMVGPSEVIILATAQIEQPVKKDVLYVLLGKNPYFGQISVSDFNRLFKRLEHDRYLWRAADDSFIVTPKAETHIREALNQKQRDKIRLLTLNERRYK